MSYGVKGTCEQQHIFVAVSLQARFGFCLITHQMVHIFAHAKELMQSFGFLCGHIIVVLVHLNKVAYCIHNNFI